MRVILSIAAALALCAAPALAGLEEGRSALQRGNYEQAAHELTGAAEAGDPDAETLLGIMYVEGFGVAGDTAKGVALLEKAAEQDDLDAQVFLAKLFEGRGEVAADLAAAAKWYERAARQGEVGAQLSIADCYLAGRGVAVDYREAYKWYRVAAAYWGDLVADAAATAASHLDSDEVAAADAVARQLIAEMSR